MLTTYDENGGYPTRPHSVSSGVGRRVRTAADYLLFPDAASRGACPNCTTTTILRRQMQLVRTVRQTRQGGPFGKWLPHWVETTTSSPSR